MDQQAVDQQAAQDLQREKAIHVHHEISGSEAPLFRFRRGNHARSSSIPSTHIQMALDYRNHYRRTHDSHDPAGREPVFRHKGTRGLLFKAHRISALLTLVAFVVHSITGI